VAERTSAGLRQIAVARAFVPLVVGGEPSTAAAAALAAVVAGQLDAAREHGAEHVRVVGTAALRAAADPDALCRMVRDHAGVTVEIVSPKEEARLAFLGATGTLPAPPAAAEAVAVVDVGGGSSEIAVGTVAEGVGWWTSLPVGSAVLSRAHIRSDPPTAAELAAVDAAARATLLDARIAEAPEPVAAYAVGGSAASLPRIVGARVTRETADRALRLLTAGPAEQVAREHGLDVRRVRLLPAGIVLLAAVAETLGGTLHVARGGLREGVVLDTGSSQAEIGRMGH
jgi:exopolyphosphatase/guanosine-5'-triphosphate,3'-diphosphate pyrophosphatase